MSLRTGKITFHGTATTASSAGNCLYNDQIVFVSGVVDAKVDGTWLELIYVQDASGNPLNAASTTWIPTTCYGKGVGEMQIETGSNKIRANIPMAGLWKFQAWFKRA